MAKLIDSNELYDEYTFFEVTKDSYESGDYLRCPACGHEISPMYKDLVFTDGVLQVIYDCDHCGKTLTFNYYLANVIAE